MSASINVCSRSYTLRRCNTAAALGNVEVPPARHVGKNACLLNCIGCESLPSALNAACKDESQDSRGGAANRASDQPTRLCTDCGDQYHHAACSNARKSLVTVVLIHGTSGTSGGDHWK